MRRVYLVGSLRDERIPEIAETLRGYGHEVFDEWFSAGPTADDSWQYHQEYKGLTYAEALRGPAAQHVFEFDKKWLDWCDTVVMIGKGTSRGIEMGYAIGRGAEGFALLDEPPSRWDLMLAFTKDVVYTVDDLVAALRQEKA